jgi:hypothetical protein
VIQFCFDFSKHFFRFAKTKLQIQLIFKVGFVGISNWALDPAKMNRGIFVHRDVPDTTDLVDTAK